jgi:hypothetical protein
MSLVLIFQSLSVLLDAKARSWLFNYKDLVVSNLENKSQPECLKIKNIIPGSRRYRLIIRRKVKDFFPLLLWPSPRA